MRTAYIGFNQGQYGDLFISLTACRVLKRCIPDSYLVYAVNKQYSPNEVNNPKKNKKINTLVKSKSAKFEKLLGNENKKIEEIINPIIVVKNKVEASLLILSKYFDTI